MSRFAPWAAAFAALAILGAPVDAAQAARRAPPPAAAPAEPLTDDDAFVLARQANAQNAIDRLDALAARLATHPLADYVGYWRLRMRLAGLRGEAPVVPVNSSLPLPAAWAAPAAPSPGAGVVAIAGPASAAEGAASLVAPPASAIAIGAGVAVAPAVPAPSAAAVAALDEEVRRAIDARPDTLVADLLRRDWLLNLARRGAWDAFEAQYPRWVLRDDVQVQCYALIARARRGDDVADAARALLRATPHLSEGCGALLEALARDGTFDRGELWGQMLYAIETQSVPSIRRVALLLDADFTEVSAALARAGRPAVRRTDRSAQLVGIARTARENPRLAAEMIGETPLAKADEAFAWSQVAAAAMRKLDPQALEWARRGLGAPASDETWTWLARAALRAQDWPTLLATIDRMSPEGQRDAAWVYWKARALQAQGRKADAEALLARIAGQYDFYGHLAAEELGTLVQPPARGAPPPTEAELAQAARNEGYARAIRFYELGLRFEGNREWNWQLRGLDDRQLLAVAHWACRQRILDRCVNTADRTAKEHDFTLRYLSPFREQLQPVASEMGLDPAWVYGLIRQESRFIMDARSGAGAQGLMQLMPATARWVARKLGVSDFRPEQLHELATNLRFGTFYLKSVYDDLEGSALLASAGYNAGPNRPRGWRATLPSAVEGAVFAEIIPFHETRDYVKKVLSNATVYSAMFTGQPQSLKQRLGRVAPRSPAPSELP